MSSSLNQLRNRQVKGGRLVHIIYTHVCMYIFIYVYRYTCVVGMLYTYLFRTGFCQTRTASIYTSSLIVIFRISHTYKVICGNLSVRIQVCAYTFRLQLAAVSQRLAASFTISTVFICLLYCRWSLVALFPSFYLPTHTYVFVYIC